MIETSILKSQSEIEAIAEEWGALHARVGRSPSSDYEWLRVWWDALGKNDARCLHVIIRREDGKLAGVLPLTVAHIGGIRFMHAAGHKAFYYCDMLAENPVQAAELWAAARRSSAYDFADIRDVHAESMCYAALSAFACKRDTINAYTVRGNWPSGEDWLASLSANTRRNHARYTRKLEEKGTLRFEATRSGALPIEIVDSMIKRKIEWSKAQGKRGLFTHSSVSMFYHRILDLALRQDRLMFSWLACGDVVVACIASFLYRGAMQGYVITYDRTWAEYSPGNVALAHSIMWAIDNGMTTVDLGQGGNSYKAKFSNEIRECAEFTFSGSLRGQILEMAFIALRKVKRILKPDILDPG